MLISNQKYSDVPFFITPNSFTGDLNLVKDLSAVRQSIKNIVMSNMGERPFDVLFGVNVLRSLFDNLTAEISLDLQRSIVSNIKRYDQRVEVLDIYIRDATEIDKTALNSMSITIYYEIPDLNIRDVVNISVARNR